MRDTKSRSVLTMVADLQLTGVDSVQKKLRRIAGDFDSAVSFDDKNFVKGWSRARTQVEKSWVQTMLKAAEASFSPGALKRITNQYESSMGRVDESRLRIEKLAMQYRERHAKGLETKAVQAEIQLERRRLSSLQKGFDSEMSHVREVAEKRREAVEESNRIAKRSASEAAEEFGTSFSEQFERLKSGDLSSLLKSAGKRLNVASVQTSQKAGEGGKNQKAYEGASSVLGKLGSAAVALGAVVAGFAALVKIMMDADSQAKELNRTLLESGVVAGDMAGSYESAGEAIDRVRKSFVGGEGAFSFNRIWGTDAKEHLQILGAYAEAGLSLKRIAAGAKDAGEEMERYRDATSHALAYSKLLGLTVNEVATSTSGYMEDLGLTLKGVQENFSELELAARESGFGTKRFFSTVLQATSGLTGYNVRLSQSASLLKTLGKVLGVKAGGELLGQLQHGYKEEGMQDRYRRLMITGGKTRGLVYGQEARNAVEELAKRLTEAPEMQRAAVQRTLSAFGIDMAKGPAGFGKVSVEKQAKLLGKAQLEGVSDELVRSIRTAVELSRGASGGIGAQASSLGNISAAGTLAFKMLEGQRLFGPLHKIRGAATEMAAQAVTGTSGTQYEQLKQLSSHFFNMDEELGKIQKNLAQGGPYDEKLAEQMARKWGIYVDREGKRRRVLTREGEAFTPGMGEAIGNSIEEIVTSSGKEFAKVAEEQVPRDIQLAQEMVQNTADMSKILEQGVQYWLEQIYSAVQGIFSFLGSKTDQKNRVQAIESISKDINRTWTLLNQQERDLTDLTKQSRTGSKEDQARLATQIAAGRDKAVAYRGRIDALSKVRSTLSATPAEFNLLDAKTVEAYQNDAIKQSRQNMIDAAKRAGVTGSPEEILGRIGMSSYFAAPAAPAATRAHTVTGAPTVNNYNLWNDKNSIVRAIDANKKFTRP